MKKYIKTYLSHFGYGPDDFMPCEMCNTKAVDVHHVEPKGMGGNKTRDNIENLIGVCRKCHERCHGDARYNNKAKELVRLRHLKIKQ